MRLDLRLHELHGLSRSLSPLSFRRASAALDAPDRLELGTAEAEIEASSIEVCLRDGHLEITVDEGASDSVVRIPLATSQVLTGGGLAILVRPRPLRDSEAFEDALPPGAVPGLHPVMHRVRHDSWLFVADSMDGFLSALDDLGSAGAMRTDFGAAYRVLEKVGEPEVYRAISALDGRRAVAAKFVSAGSSDKAGQTLEERVQREASILSVVQGHPNVVRLLGLFHTGHTAAASAGAGAGGGARPGAAARCESAVDGAIDLDLDMMNLASVESAPAPAPWVLTTELFVGSLCDRIQLRGAYTEQEARPIFGDVVSALAHLHDRAIIHRDVKAANVMFRADGCAVLSDFSLSCSSFDDEETWKTVGSPGYIAPEIVLREGCRFESDIWSLGVTLYAMLAGELPFWGTTVLWTLRRSVASKVDFSQHEAFAYVSKACRIVIQKTVSRTPTDRPTACALLRHTWLMSGYSHGSLQPIQEMPSIDERAEPEEARRQASAEGPVAVFDTPPEEDRPRAAEQERGASRGARALSKAGGAIRRRLFPAGARRHAAPPEASPARRPSERGLRDTAFSPILPPASSGEQDPERSPRSPRSHGSWVSPPPPAPPSSCSKDGASRLSQRVAAMFRRTR